MLKNKLFSTSESAKIADSLNTSRKRSENKIQLSFIIDETFGAANSFYNTSSQSVFVNTICGGHQATMKEQT